jgi:hypothetical protein
MARVSSKDFFDVGQSSVHPGNNLVKFGYIIGMKLEKKKIKQNPSTF